MFCLKKMEPEVPALTASEKASCAGMRASTMVRWPFSAWEYFCSAWMATPKALAQSCPEGPCSLALELQSCRLPGS